MLGLFPRAPGAEGRSRGSRCRRVGVPVSVEDTPELRDPAAYGAGGGRLWGAGREAPKRARGVPEPFGRESGRRCPPRGRGAPPGRSRPSDKPRPFLASDPRPLGRRCVPAAALRSRPPCVSLSPFLAA